MNILKQARWFCPMRLVFVNTKRKKSWPSTSEFCRDLVREYFDKCRSVHGAVNIKSFQATTCLQFSRNHFERS